ncbi:hypothetical protein AB0B28_20445 [Glycomyces sp. NPDC046736]|uniref:hypothetical protein n=1 Tax=Glycomyces sp. NPDC046736 TaxID=3155615 RepID=UPI0033FCB71E
MPKRRKKGRAVAQHEPSAVQQFIAGLDDADRIEIAALEGRSLDLKQTGPAAANMARPGEPRGGLLDSLRTWQWLIEAMEGGWTAPSTSIVYEYLNELTARDRLEGLRRGMRDPLRHKFDRLLADLDQRFRARTFHDHGEELAQYWKPLAEGREARWYWLRRPITLPLIW